MEAKCRHCHPTSMTYLPSKGNRGGQGDPILAEQLLSDDSLSEEACIDVIYNEFLLRRARGSVDPDEFLLRFPDYAEELRKQFEVHATIELMDEEAWVPEPVENSSRLQGEVRPTVVAGEYRIEREVGRGGMGIVYEATQLSLGRRVAVKVMHQLAALDEQKQQRFVNEARVVSLLNHENIVPIHVADREGASHFHVMKYIDGGSVSRLIKRLQDSERKTDASSDFGMADYPMRRSFDWIAQVGIDVAEALHAAHREGVVHRDVKPSNLLLDQAGKVWLTDFGLASAEDSASLTEKGDLLGTLPYMSPEQAKGDHATVDRRTDVYSLGATLYELATLRRPFSQESREQIMDRVSRGEIVAPRSLEPQVPRELETVILKAMQRDPERRYNTSAELAGDLRRFVQRVPVQAGRATWGDHATRWVERHKALAALALASWLVVSVVSVVAAALVMREQSRTAKALDRTDQMLQQKRWLLDLAVVQRAYAAWDTNRPHQIGEILKDRQRLPQLERDTFEWALITSLSANSSSRILGRHRTAATELAVFPSGRHVASVGEDGLLQVLEIENAMAPMRVQTGSPMYAVAVSSDGTWIATGGETAQLWDAKSGEHIRTLTKYNDNIESLAFSPNARLIVSGSRYGRIRLQETATGVLVKELKDGARHAFFGFLDDHRLLGLGRLPSPDRINGIGYVTQWDDQLNTLREWFTDAERSEDYTMAAMSLDRRVFLFTQRYNHEHSRVMDGRTGEELFRLPPNRSPVETSDISAHGREIAVGFENGTVEYWRLGEDSEGRLLPPTRTYSLKAHEGAVHCVRFLDRDHLLTCGADGVVRLWDITYYINPIGVDVSVEDLAISPDGHTIAVACQDGGLQFRNAAGDLIDDVIPQDDDYLNRVDYSYDGAFVATGCMKRELIELRDGGTGDVLDSRPLRAIDLCFSPTRQQLAAVNHLGDVVIYEVANNRLEVVDTLSADDEQDGAGYTLQYSPDGSKLLCAGEFGAIAVFDVADVSSGIRETGITSLTRVVSLAFAADGATLASGHSDGKIRLWDWSLRTPLHELMGHEGQVAGLAFSPDGRLLASTGIDQTTRLWNVTERAEIGVASRQKHRGVCVAFSPDGRKLYSGHVTYNSDTGSPGLLILNADQ